MSLDIVYIVLLKERPPYEIILTSGYKLTSFESRISLVSNANIKSYIYYHNANGVVVIAFNCYYSISLEKMCYLHQDNVSLLRHSLTSKALIAGEKRNCATCIKHLNDINIQ